MKIFALLFLVASCACFADGSNQNNNIQHSQHLKDKIKAEGGLKSVEYYDKGEYAPDDIAIFDESENKVYLEQFEGNVVLIVFWATWCSHCIDEMVDLDILQKDFRKFSFKVLPISEDYSGVATVKSFYEKHDLRHLPILHDFNSQLFQAFSLSGLPTTFLVNEDGIIMAKFSGIVNWHDEIVRSMLLSYIPGNNAMPRNTYKESAFKFNKNHKQQQKSDINNDENQSKESDVANNIADGSNVEAQYGNDGQQILEQVKQDASNVTHVEDQGRLKNQDSNAKPEESVKKSKKSKK